tara:strand:- start:4452 stop:5000 length:549 start_codon:yes stop_codon:yes gene_type:complete
MPMTFDPDKATEKKEFKILPPGKYFTHIAEYGDPVSLTTKKGAECDILKLVLNIDEKSHPDYAGNKIWADVWITKKVNGLDPDSSDNIRFYRFLESINYPLEEEEAEIDGTVKKVKLLPQGKDEIFQEYIVGKPIIVSTKEDKYRNKMGEEVISSKVTYFEEWKGKEPIQIDKKEEEEDLPF